MLSAGRWWPAPMEAFMAARLTLSTVRFVPATTLRGSLRGLGGQLSLGRIWTSFTRVMRARQTRQLLAEMDDRMLADIGVGRGDAITEASRAPWDLHERRI